MQGIELSKRNIKDTPGECHSIGSFVTVPLITSVTSISFIYTNSRNTNLMPYPSSTLQKQC